MIQFMQRFLGQHSDSSFRFVFLTAYVLITLVTILNSLQIAVDDSEKMGEMLVALERIALLIDRCALYETLYLGEDLKAAKGLEKALTGLYAAILCYLTRAKQVYSQSTGGKPLDQFSKLQRYVLDL